MTLNELFSYKTDVDIGYRSHIKKADALTDLKSVEFYDSHAARMIADYKNTIELLEEYRKTLFNRYQEIATAPYKLVLKLERTIHFEGNKYYTITLIKRFSGTNIADEEMKREKFTGKERHKALKRFEELEKEYPTTETEIDIEKKRWER